MGKHIPKRMCIACRSMRPKSELMRIVKTEGGAEFDENDRDYFRLTEYGMDVSNYIMVQFLQS